MGLKEAIVAAVVVMMVVGKSEGANNKEVVELGFWNMSAVYRGDWLLVLYAPWCGHCQRLHPLLPQLAARADNCRVAKADADAYQALQVQFGITGFPVILRLHDGSAHEYSSGARGAEELLGFIDNGWKQVAPLSAWTGPTSLLKRALGVYAHIVLCVYARIVALAERLGVNPPLLAGAVAGGVVVLAIVLAVVCSLGSGNVDQIPKQTETKKKKEEQQPLTTTTTTSAETSLRQRKKDKKKKKPADK